MVKCANCGLLGGQVDPAGPIVELSEVTRATGQYEVSVRQAPVCLAGEIDFTRFPNIGAPVNRLVIFEEDRGCASFTPWRRGFTPKEHLELLDRRWRIEQEEKTRQLVWAREDDRDARAELWHQEQLAEIREQHKSELFWFGGAVTAIIVLATIAGSLIQAGWIPNPRGNQKVAVPVVVTAVPQPTPGTRGGP